MIEDNTAATPLNFAMVYYMNLNNRIIIKDNAYMENDAYGYYKGLDRIYNLIYFKVKEEPNDVSEIDMLLDIARKGLVNRERKDNIMEILHKIDKKLMLLMHKYDMIFPNIKSTYGIDKVYKKYNIQNNVTK